MAVQPLHAVDNEQHDDPGLADSPSASSHFPQQLTALAQSLSCKLEELEMERAQAAARIHTLEEVHQQALARIRVLEQMHDQSQARVRTFEAMQHRLHEARANTVNKGDVQATASLANALVENSQNIVVLARISDHAAEVKAIVDDYTRLCGVLAEV